MQVLIVALFPETLGSHLDSSILGLAQKKGLFQWQALALREFCGDKHGTADDRPFGGGAGMVLKAEPVLDAIREARGRLPKAKVLHLSPRGRRLDQALARELAQEESLILLCSHYEGLDERAMGGVDLELSVGDFVLSSGELAACVLVDALVRLLPGVLGNAASADEESFENGLLEYPHYTRPAAAPFGSVPEVLLSGNHAAIAAWRRRQSLKTTYERRPDLLGRGALDKEDVAFLRSLGWQGGSDAHNAKQDRKGNP
ncbi:MAG TPA: tRNA (guanosine(37)-N1)-methyltransferase TrmD [bacterium]|jgi:tRNA (guanine37-N1)-methyltransferase|nr:tRNA (guanosine(37)-N1)-methyltransferase TrmD [bacterium]